MPSSKFNATRHYAAFLSYRHADNKEDGRRWAEWLHQSLETYEIPRDLVGKTNQRGVPVPTSLYPVFRDEEELPADADLSQNIRRALENSDLLIVLCSPRACQSRFVAEEIRYFKELGKSDRILALMIDGEPNADDPAKAAQGITLEMECFPEPLRFGIPVDGGRIDWTQRTEPIAADVRPQGRPNQGYTSAAAYRVALERTGTQNASTVRIIEKAYAAQLETARLKLAAGALGVPLGELRERDAIYRARKFRRLAAGLGSLSLVALLAAGVAVWQTQRANHSAHESQINADLASDNAQRAGRSEQAALSREQEARHTLSMSDYFRASVLVAEQKRPDALAYLARAIRSEPTNLAAGQRALLALQQGCWYLPEPWPPTPGYAPIAATFTTEGRLRILGVAQDIKAGKATGAHLCVFDEGQGRLFQPTLLSAPEMEQFEGPAFLDRGNVFTAIINGEPRYWSAQTGLQTNLVSRESPDRQKSRELARQLNLTADETNVKFSPDKKGVVVITSHGGELSDVISSIEVDAIDRQPLIYRTKKVEIDCADLFWLPDSRYFLNENSSLWDTYGNLQCILNGEAVSTRYAWQSESSADGRELLARGRWKRLGVAPFPLCKDDAPMDHSIWRPFVTPRIEKNGGQLQMVWDETTTPVTLSDSGDASFYGMSPDGGTVLGLVNSTDDSTRSRARVWDGHSGRCVATYPLGKYKQFLGVTNRLGIAYDGSGRILEWNIRTGEPLASGLQTGFYKQTGLGISAAIHTDGEHLFVCFLGVVEVWDLRSSTMEGRTDMGHRNLESTDLLLSDDGRLLATTGGIPESDADQTRLWNAQALVPMTDLIDYRDLWGAEADGPDFFHSGAFYVADKGVSDGAGSRVPAEDAIYVRFQVPASGPVPDWLAELLEAVAGRRFGQNDTLVDVAPEERRVLVEKIRRQLGEMPVDDPWVAAARWWLDDGPDRKVAPGNSITVARAVNKRLAADSPSLTATGLAVPGDARIFHRLSLLYRKDDPSAADDYAKRAEALGGPAAPTRSGPTAAPTATPVQPGPTPPRTQPTPAETPPDGTELFQQAERLRKGDGVPRDPVQALALYRRAAALGNPNAQHRLGVLYATGDSVPKSDTEAVKWYRQAAEGGLAEAQFDLGVRCMLGKGTIKDEAAGLEWYRKAALQGYQPAIDLLRQKGRWP